MLPKVEWKQLFSKRGTEISQADKLLETAHRLGATHVVRFENQQLDSSRLGYQSWLCVGPGLTYVTPEALDGKWLNDLPSQRQQAMEYAEVPCGS